METTPRNPAEHPLNARIRMTDQPQGMGYRRSQLGSMDARQVIAIALIALGMVGVVIAWFGISGTLDPGAQMPFLASGGIGGAALIAIGVTVYISWEHVQDRAVLGILLERLGELEAALREATALESPTHPAPTNGTAKRTRAIRAERSTLQ